MDWYFYEEDILQDYETGYKIVLVSGDWSYPTELRPVIPRGLSAHEQVRYLRLGLAYAKRQALQSLGKVAV